MQRYSPNILLIWSLAATEAVTSSADEIEPAHLLLGLCKFCDLDLDELYAGFQRQGSLIRRQTEIQRETLRSTFSRIGVDAAELRRKLRPLIARPGLGMRAPNMVDRSPGAREIFHAAERRSMHRPLSPVDLLIALLQLPYAPWELLIEEMADREALDKLLGRERPEQPAEPAEGEAQKSDRPPETRPLPPPRSPRLPENEDDDSELPDWLRNGISSSDDERDSRNGAGDDELPRPLKRPMFPPGRMPGRPGALPGSAAASGTPNLDRYGRDLSRLAREGQLDPVIGREAEMRNLARVLAQKRKNNAILVGEAGVGKTCIVEGLAQALTLANAEPSLKNKRIVEISMTSLVAGTKYRGEFEERIEAVLREASADKNIILFVDEIHTILAAGAAEGALDAANILKPALARGDLRCIGATTVGEYRKYIERDPALERRFQMLWVEEPTPEETMEILRGLRPRFEEHHGLKIDDEAIEAAVRLSVRYLPDFRLPDKAVDLIDQACASARIQSLSVAIAEPCAVEAQPEEAPADPGKVEETTQAASPQETAETTETAPEAVEVPLIHIGRTDIVSLVAQRSRLPIDELEADEAQRLLRMEDALRRRVIGQEEAIAEVSHAVRMARAGLKDPNKPVGAFLFVGPTGTGKTELAKTLAEFLFGNERLLIRLDMSEYMEKSAVARLIGAPPGYIGHDEEGQLTGQVRSHPYSVVLFDEVEKAHPEVLDILLQILDQGVLTDSKGRHVSFTETIIIMTSNLGNQLGGSTRPLGFSQGSVQASERYREQVMSIVTTTFRPELLNRIQQIVTFQPLGVDIIRQIIDKYLVNLHTRLGSLDLHLELSDAAYALLMEEGYDTRYGAREMERAIDRMLTRPLSMALLEGRFPERSRIYVDADEERLVLEPIDPDAWEDHGLMDQMA